MVGTWLTPTLTGKHPPVRFVNTLTMIDEHRAVLFGGSFFGETTPIHFLLDLDLMASTSIGTGSWLQLGGH